MTFTILLKNSSSKTTVKTLDFKDFHHWEDGHSVNKLNNVNINNPRPLFANMVQVVAQRGLVTLKYKTSFDAEFHSVDFLSKKGLENLLRG